MTPDHFFLFIMVPGFLVLIGLLPLALMIKTNYNPYREQQLLPFSTLETTVQVLNYSEQPMFFLFAGDEYYPLGGAKDFRGCFDSIDGALDFLHKISWDWYQICDNKFTIVKTGNCY